MSNIKLTPAQTTALRAISAGAPARTIHTTILRNLDRRGLVRADFYGSAEPPELTDAGRDALSAS